MTQPIPQGYKLTEIGVIPEDWEVKSLEQIAEKIMVGIASAATHAYRERGIPFLRNQNILPNKLDDTDILFISPEYEATFQNKRLKIGDLLTARTGYPGTTCIVTEKYNGAQSFTTLITRLKKYYSNPTYVSLYMNSEAGDKFFELNQIGGGQKNVNSAILKTLPLPFPSLEEQTAIATALSDVDALISGLESLITKKQAIKTATMQKLLTGKTRLPQFAHHPDGTAKGYKQTELGLVPEDWEVESIGKNCQTYSGGTPLTSNKSFYGGDIFWITSSDLNKKIIFEVDGRITEGGLYSSSAKMVQSGTFLIALYGATAGVCAISMIEAAINQAVLAVIPSCHKSEYLYYWFTKNKDEIIETYTQGGQPNLSGDIIRSIKIPFPSKEEQTAIAQILSDMDEEIQALEARLSKTKQIKQGMMQVLLTGKVRLV